MKIQNTSNVSENMSHMIFLYGKAGLGKTTTCKFINNALLIDIESGATVLNDSDIDYVSIEKSNEIFEAIREARSTDYETIIVDSCTMFEQMVLTEFAMSSKAGLVSLQQYGILNNKINKLFAMLNGLKLSGKNVIVTFLELPIKIEESDMSLKTTLYPYLRASKQTLIQKLVGICDVCCRLEMGKSERFLRLEGTDEVFAKNRILKGKKAIAVTDISQLLITTNKEK